MVLQNDGSILKDILKKLCCNDGWSYGVFWSYNHQNSLLLTLQDAYCEDQTEVLIDDMILQVHKLGEGVIGRAAYTLKHQFINSYAYNNKQNFTESTEGFEIYQDNFEFCSQFLCGIKTILVIPVEQLGVVQFGSLQKVSETMDFVEQTKALFSEMRDGLISNEDMLFSANSEILSSSAPFPSYISSDNSWSPSCGYLPCEEQQTESELPLTNLIWPFPSSFDEMIDPTDNQFSFDGCIYNIPLQQSFIPASSSINNAIEISSSSQKSVDSEPWMYPGNSTLQGMTNQNFYGELFQDNDITNNLFQLLVPDLSNMLLPDTLNNLVHDSDSFSSSREGHTNKASECNPSTSVQSSISDVFTTIENNKHSAMSGIENLLDYSGEDIECRSINLSDFITRGHNDNSGVGSMCISRSKKKLFPSLGINHLLDDVSSSSCSFVKSRIEDQLSSANKRRRIDTPLPRIDTESLSSLSSSGGKMNIIPLIYNSNTMSNVRSARDAINRPLPNSSICDSFSIHGEKVSQHKQSEPPIKNAKKKSKPGIRTRPKDRQQIQDRLMELRKLIPKAEKMSIDCLLHRTINHLIFLQSVAEHAESIKKLTNSTGKVFPRDVSTTCHNGVTWACEVDDQTMICPLIVEDLSTPGQMSIEIKCEEQGSFLEIVDIIRGFGLAILKGVMESQEDKMYARFTVATEGNNHVTRHEIFSSLVQLLQFTNLSGVSPSNQFNDAANGGVGLFSTWKQSSIQLPIRSA